ncbi:MAG: TMEM175 family protein [Deltaproteobacteria bacterium]
MTKSRIEAFSDGVIAIIITIMVLELKIPHGSELSDLAELWPVFISYILSFTFVGIYWANHHHLLHSVKHINSRLIYANLTLLFFLSLIPFTTGWMGENHFENIPVAVYGLNLLLSAISYFILQQVIMADAGHSNRMLDALSKQKQKGIISLFIYIISIPFALYYPIISAVLFALVSILWIIPDKNIENALKDS